MKNGQFVLDESYAQSDVDINCLDTAAELSEAAEKLFLCVNEGKAVKMVENGRCRLPDLEEGVYLLWGTEQARQGMLPNLLFLPTWQEMTREMQYELVVVPKLVDKGTPHTGDAGLQVWGIVAGVSFLAVVIIVMGKEFRKKKRFLP
ncbi:MAG: hypothetical protein UHS49_01600 [Faecalimonas sp.]|nr:hypothetical protein [Faecalimonas sp.]